MELEPGHKLTEVGAIPDDWNAVPLREIAWEIGDGIHGTPTYASTETYYFINGNNLRGGRIVITDDTKAVNYREYKKFKKSLGDSTILMSVNGTIGNLGLFEGETIILGKSAAYLNLRPTVSRRYVYYSLQIEAVTRQFSGGLTGTTIGNLGLATLRNSLIPLPATRAEQDAIAEMLDDADTHIESLEHLLAKKRQIKQGAMQELLSPKPDWVKKRLGDIADVKDGTHQTPRYVESGIPFYSVENVTRNDFTDTKYISVAEHRFLTRFFKMKRGDILMTRIGSIGDCKLIDWEVDASFYVSLALLKVRSGYSAPFLAHYSRSESFKKEVELNSLQSAIPKKINLGPISNIRIRIPVELDEQNSIAAVLSAMEAEVTALKQKLAKARSIKQGMMQELLTGRIRLV